MVTAYVHECGSIHKRSVVTLFVHVREKVTGGAPVKKEEGVQPPHLI